MRLKAFPEDDRFNKTKVTSGLWPFSDFGHVKYPSGNAWRRKERMDVSINDGSHERMSGGLGAWQQRTGGVRDVCVVTHRHTYLDTHMKHNNFFKKGECVWCS